MTDLSSWARSVSKKSAAAPLVRDMESLLLGDHPRERDKLVVIYAEAVTAIEVSRRSHRGGGLGPAWREKGFAPLLWTMICEAIALAGIILGLGILFGSAIDRVLPFASILAVAGISAAVGTISAWLAELIRNADKAIGNNPVTLHIVYAVLTAATAALAWARLSARDDAPDAALGYWPALIALCALSLVALTVVGVRNQKRLSAAWASIQKEWDEASVRSTKPITELLDRAQRRSTNALKGLPLAVTEELLSERQKAIAVLAKRGLLDDVVAAIASEAPLGCAQIAVERARENGLWE